MKQCSAKNHKAKLELLETKREDYWDGDVLIVRRYWCSECGGEKVVESYQHKKVIDIATHERYN